MTSIRGSGSIVRWISEPAIQEETAEKLGVSVIPDLRQLTGPF